MARIKYYYDTESCKYERVKVSTWDIILNFFGFLLVTLIFSVIIVFIYVSSPKWESPKEAKLRKENEELHFHYDILKKELSTVHDMMGVLQERDDHVYRVIMEAEPIPTTIRSAGFGGANRYQELIDKGLEREELVIGLFERIDKIKKQLYIQTKSYDEILTLAMDKSKMLASIPAIQPISNKDLTRFASGFGMRMHPILKQKRMHNGCDFTATRGTPIYATGDGKVVSVKTSLGGFGKLVIIDHGYGYITRYAHLQKFNVKEGQKIKRGECLGYVGNTGLSTAPHLHYEILKDSRPVNPVYYFYNDLNDQEYEILLEKAAIENQSLG